MKKWFLLFIIILLVRAAVAVPLPYLSFDNLGMNTQQLSVRALSQDAKRTLWIGTEDGLFSYDGYLLRRHDLYVSDETSHQRPLHLGGVTQLLCDGDSLLVGCSAGLLAFRLDDYSVSRLGYAQDEPILGIYRKDEQLWVVSESSVFCNGKRLPLQTHITGCGLGVQGLLVGTTEGVCRFVFNDLHMERLTVPLSKAKCFLPVMQNGALWVGNEESLILWDEMSDGVIYELSVPVAKSLGYDSSGNLLVSTDNGLYVLSPRREVSIIRHDARTQTSLSGDIVWCTYIDVDKNLWIGTNCGMSLVGSHRRLYALPLPIITGEGQGNQISCIFCDSFGRFWLGGTTGLIYVENYRRNFRDCRWYRMDDERYPIRHNRIRTIKQDNQKRVWVGGDGGLMCFNEKTSQFDSFFIAEDPNNWVYDIQVMGNEELFISTYDASYIGRADMEHHRFVVSQQFEKNDISQNRQRQHLESLGLDNRFYSYWRDTINDRYFLGGTDIVAIFNPKRSVADYPLLVTDIMLDDNQYVSQKDITERNISISYHNHDIEFYFSDFDYADQIAGQYYYSLSKGGPWTPIRPTDHSILIQNLRAGRYNLYIRHSDTPEDAELEPLFHFVIETPWYLSIYANVFYLLVFVLIVYAVYQLYLQRRRYLVERFRNAKRLVQAQQKQTELKTNNEYLENQLKAHLRQELGEPEQLTSDDRFLAQITDIIREHLDDSELNVQRLSELSGVGTKQLYRRIKQLTGLTTVAYIRDLRLKRAAILLAEHDLTVSEVMYRVGFTCPSYFARCFYETYGKSPSEYDG